MSASFKEMKEHGKTTVTVDGRVVRNRPRYGSNNEGIRHNWELVLKAASGLDYWVLWADAHSSFAMTPESLDLIIARLKTLKENGCIALAFTISNPIIPYYIRKIESEISIPFLASQSIDEIRTFIENTLEELQ
ncbi:MAG: hypothetical protein J7L76_02620 [Spirochaetaceae bacterium]|nr:hypothetical protein [Spirochaetaceae bacterium]